VRAIAAAGAAEPRGWRRWLATGDGRRRLAVAGGPVVAVVIALAVAIPVMTRDDGGTAPQASGGVPATGEAGAGDGAAGASVATQAAPQRAAAPRDSASTAAPAPAPEAFSAAPAQADGAATAPAPAAKAMELDRAVARARAALERAGATSVRTQEAPDGAQAVVVAAVPADAVDAITTTLKAQGAAVATDAGDTGTATVRATVTAGG
ncbi:MAG TPA: hypothetical protein VL422_04490, partial [Miltoncostaea sp.]|nr:hypothetical protein [Miltoncostaea sp.]